MRSKSILSGMAVLFGMAMVSHAADTVLDWQFNTAANPSSPNDSTSTVNPSNWVATAGIVADTYQQYYFNAFPTTPPGQYGTERGLWDIISSTPGAGITLNLGAGVTFQGETLNYTLQVRQFLGNPQFLPGLLAFSLGTPATTSQVVLDTVPGGQWVQDTFTWTVTPDVGDLTLTIGPQSAGGELLIDEVTWDITGALAVPEPSTLALAGLGMLAFVMRGRLRPKP